MTDLTHVQILIQEEGDRAVDLLLEKNKAYGNSAISPKRFLSQADKTEQIRVRIDDKLNRLVNGLTDEEEEDVVLDLIGYLILLRVAQRVQAEEDSKPSAPLTELTTIVPNTTTLGPGGFNPLGPVYKSFNEGSYD